MSNECCIVAVGRYCLEGKGTEPEIQYPEKTPTRVLIPFVGIIQDSRAANDKYSSMRNSKPMSNHKAQHKTGSTSSAEGEYREEWKKIVPHSMPIYQTSVYDYPDLESLDDYYNGRIPGAYIYSRNGLPNSSEAGRLVAEFEHADAGLACASGMGSLLVALMSVVGQGEHIVASNELYGGTSVLINKELSRFGIESTFVDATSVSAIEDAVKPNTKVILVESISNPTMKVCDIEATASVAHRAEKATLIVDNTFATPFVLKPLTLGANLVMHSGTKSLGGHGDITIGFLCGDCKLISRANEFCSRSGVIAGPFDCWLATRSLATWEIRVKQACSNAIKLASFLESRSDTISKVYYPGLRSHPQYFVAKRMFSDGLFGSMLSFTLNDEFEKASAFVRALKKVTLTPSLGSYHTSISHPGKTSHRNITEAQKRESGITDSMIRVSVGIEDYQSIEEDFGKALDSIR